MSPVIELPNTRPVRDWSPQQQAVFAAVEDPDMKNLRVDAVAGAGKTTTLVEACYRMQGRVAFLAFNKRIADEIKGKVISARHVKAGTFHSFGLASWKQVAPRCEVDSNKTDQVIEDLDVPRWQRAFVAFMVSMAKQGGIGIIGDIENNMEWEAIAEHFDAYEKLGEGVKDSQIREAIRACQRVLFESINRAFDIIDFDDMLYMPLKAQCVKPEYDRVLIDEAQDTNSVRRLLAQGLVLPGPGRIIAVGDPHQAIYGFTGASHDAMDLIEEAFECVRMPLTVTYRCPKSVVRRAQTWVSHIQAHESAPEGITRTMPDEEFQQLDATVLDKSTAVLCRNTKPLIELALTLMRRRIPCKVEGRDLGKSLITLAFRWKSIQNPLQLIDKLDDYLWNETEKLRKKDQRGKIASLTDRVTSLQALIKSLPSNASMMDLRSLIENLFVDSEDGKQRSVILSTIHKAKGREWQRVFWLHPDIYNPSPWAKMEWELEQENNICYVAVTRAKQELIEVLALLPGHSIPDAADELPVSRR